MACGLVKGHAYSVTGLEEVSLVESGGHGNTADQVDPLKSGLNFLCLLHHSKSLLVRSELASRGWRGLWDKPEEDVVIDTARLICV